MKYSLPEDSKLPTKRPTIALCTKIPPTFQLLTRPPLSLYLVLDTQPLPEPPARVGVHGAVGLADRTETEVVGPANQKTVQPGYPILHVQQRPSPTGHRADLLAESRDFLRRRPRADVAFARLRRMTAADGVPQEVERLVR